MRRWILLGVALAVLVTLGIWLAARREVARPMESGARALPRAAALPELEGAERVAERSALAGRPEEQLATETAASDAAPITDLLRVSGSLREGRARAPIAGALVRLVGEHVQANATTAGSGRFQLELDPAKWALGETVGVTATLAATGTNVFTGPVALDSELTLLGLARFTLRGRLVTEAALGFGEDERVPLMLGVSIPAAFDGGGRFLGTTRLGRAQRFELEAWIERLPPAFQLVFASGPSQLLSVEVRADLLASREGATIRLPLARLEVHVVDERGQPLAGAQVRAKPLPLERGAAILSGTTDDSGLVRFHVPPGEVELAVGLAGHGVYVAVLAIAVGPGRAERVVLRPLAPSERVAGRVVDAHGLPVSGAWVSACPRTLEGELASVAAAGQRSDDEGRFDLAAGANVELAVLAHHEDLGFSSTLVAPSGTRELLLVIAPQGTLRVNLEGLPAGAAASGGLEWLRIDAEDQAESGRDWGRTLVLEPMPAGESELFVRMLGSGHFGSAALSVAPGDNHVALRLHPAARVHGTLLERDGTPAAGRALVLEGLVLPPAAAAHFAHGRSDGLGGFDLLLGSAHEGVLSVQRDGADPVRFPVTAGEALVLRLP